MPRNVFTHMDSLFRLPILIPIDLSLFTLILSVFSVILPILTLFIMSCLDFIVFYY